MHEYMLQQLVTDRHQRLLEEARAYAPVERRARRRWWRRSPRLVTVPAEKVVASPPRPAATPDRPAA
jgi:hypothetical protein